MEFSMEWNVICRVCLQEGEMLSIFSKDIGDVLISEKIMNCSNVKIEKGVNLPENICKKCLENLRVAYAFRNNCESSDAVLQSFVKGNMISDLVICSNGEIYKYKPPDGLKVKRIPKEARTFVKEEGTEEEKLLEMVEEDMKDEEEPETNEEIFGSGEFETFDEENMGVDEPPSPSTDDHPSPTEDPYEMSDKSDQDDSNSNPANEPNLVAMPGYMVIEDGPNVYTVKVQGAESSAMSLIEDTRDSPRNKDPNVLSESRRIAVPRPPRPRVKGEKPMHICEICGNSYKHRHSLETHMRRHRNEKPFACEICGRAFVLNVELKCHMRTHTGQKPYPCRFCGRRFSDFGSRIKHERTHTGERPYACETCGKAFAYSYGLTSHILTHTGEKRFECERCGKRFAKKHHLKNHMNTHMKQETRLKHIRTQTPTNIIVNATSNSGIASSDDEYSSMLTVLTGDQNIEQTLDQYVDINVVEIKQEMEEEGAVAIQEMQEMPS